MEEKIKRLVKWFKGKKAPPIKVDFSFTSRCNLKCLFCSFPSADKNLFKFELEKEELLEIVNECAELDVKVIGILGGEPFVRKDALLPMMNLIKDYGIDGAITTNGTLFTREIIIDLVKIEWNLLRFSLDGACASTHDYLRGVKGTFEKVIDSIRLFTYYKKKFRKDLPILEVNMVLTNKNYREIPDLIKLIHKLGIERLYVLPMIEFPNTKKDLKIRREEKSEVVKYLLEAKRIAKEKGLATNLEEIIDRNLILKSNKMDEVLLNSDGIPCLQPWYSLGINAVGLTAPCVQIEDGVSIREKSLREIWYGEFFNRFRQQMLEKKLHKACLRCCMPIMIENEELRKKLNDLGVIWTR